MSVDQVKRLYESMPAKLDQARRRFGRPLTLAEKILVAHADDFAKQEWSRGKAQLRLRVDRVALQDATGQMALLQFMQAGKKQVAVPSTVHCDHLIRAESGAAADMERAIAENREVYDFLHSTSKKYGIGFWKPGAGIIHQVVLENYAFPGGLMIGADSHTPNAGGLGMAAIGVGGADCGEAMAGLAWEVLDPKLIGVHLTGKLTGWSSPKDVITYLCGLLTVKGATTSLFHFDDRMAAYLRATERADIARLAEQHRQHLVADPDVIRDPRKVYDEVVEINLSELEPHIVGPHSPDRARPISKLAAEVKKEGWPAGIRQALIGSCTNSSYEDMRRASHIAMQALKAGVKAKTPFLVTPGSERIYQTIKRDGMVDTFQKIGGTVLANACGPCIGQWKRSDVGKEETNTIVSSFNRNFPGRNDGSASTLSFLTGPEGEELPAQGFAGGDAGFEAPAADGDSVQVAIAPNSERLQLLQPFPRWDGHDFGELPILVKTKGKTTTDHISPAGAWLRYRGHLDKISDNMFLGTVNAFTGEPGKGVNPITGESGKTLSQIARDLKARGLGWVVIGDENYGEGSSREHAAMSPRYLGGKVVIVK